MKKVLTLVAALALVSGASVAQAVDNAWFTVEGGGVADSQGSGQTLVITRNPGDVTNLTIGFNITDTEDLGMAGYSFDVFPAPGSVNNATFGGAANVGTGYTGFFPGATGASLQFGAIDFTGNGSTGLVATFNLTVTGATPGALNIVGQHGPTETAYLTGLWFGSVGPNAPDFGSPASYGTWGDLPVITINTIPEPASIGILALGALALIRRRK